MLHFLRPFSSKTRSAPKIVLLPQRCWPDLSNCLGYLLGVLKHQRPTHHSFWARALAAQLPPPAPSHLDQWLLSGRWSHLSHLPTHLSTAKTGAFCYQVAQMPGNLTPGVKEEAIGETTQHLVPCLLPFTAWGHRDPVGLIHSPMKTWDHKDCMVTLALLHNRGQHSSRMRNTSPLASFSKQLECYLFYNILVGQRSTAEANSEKHNFISYL